MTDSLDNFRTISLLALQATRHVSKLSDLSFRDKSYYTGKQCHIIWRCEKNIVISAGITIAAKLCISFLVNYGLWQTSSRQKNPANILPFFAILYATRIVSPLVYCRRNCACSQLSYIFFFQNRLIKLILCLTCFFNLCAYFIYVPQ